MVKFETTISKLNTIPTSQYEHKAEYVFEWIERPVEFELHPEGGATSEDRSRVLGGADAVERGGPVVRGVGGDAEVHVLDYERDLLVLLLLN